MADTGTDGEADRGVPLILDVDGTLLRTDLLLETLWAALAVNFLATVRVVLSNLAAPARLKRELCRIARPEIARLPVRGEVLDMARRAAAQNRPVHLASGADQGLVDALARHLGLAGEHFGSDGERNLTRAAKAALLVERFGPGGFDYAGNGRADLDIWRAARRIIAVSPPAWLSRRIARLGKPVEELKEPGILRPLIREMRPYQWAKNLLLFVPLLASHSFSPAAFATVFLAAVAFSIGASSIYIINDLLDLDADRRHPEKRNRPIASGALPIREAMIASIVLGGAALGLAAAISPAVAGFVFAYMMSSLVYSLWLKRLVWVDLFTLASLFLLRVLTGGAAAQTGVSGWLLVFIFAVFFTLACVKRLTALARAVEGGHLPGRGYGPDDMSGLNLAAHLGTAAAVVWFLAYTFSDTAAQLYSSPGLLRLSALPIALWLLRIIRLSEQGKEDYDPLAFVEHDRLGLLIALSGLGIAFLAV